MASLKELKEQYPNASMDEIKRLADKASRKPEIDLHKWHRFAAVGYFMGFATFMGISVIKKANFLPLIVILVILAVAEVILGIVGIKALKGNRIQQEDELARQLMNKAGKMTAATMLMLGGVLEVVFAVTECSFTVSASNIGALLFAVYCLVSGFKSLYFVLLDRVDGEEEE